MTLLAIDTVILAGKISSFCTFTDEGRFMFHHFLKSEDELIKKYLNDSKFTHFCFDVFKIWDAFGEELPFLWDVKILYELLGYKIDNFIAFSKEILGNKDLERYEFLSSRIISHINSYKIVKIKINAHEAVKVLPHDLLQEFYMERSSIIKKLFLSLDESKKEFYIKFYDSLKFIYKIGKEPLDIDLGSIREDISHHAACIRRNVKSDKLYLKFKPVAAKTGRLGFQKSSVNLYTLPKELRKCILPEKNYKLVQFDFKSCQPRIAMCLTQNEEFKELVKNVEDIYSIFPGEREEIKLGFLAWMFSKSRIPGSVYEKFAWPIWELRESLAKLSTEQGFLKTIFGRKLYNNSEPKHIIFQNFITATEVDMILNVGRELHKEGLDIKTPYHDAIIAQVKNLDCIERYKNLCENYTKDIFGTRFPVSVTVGDNLGSMENFS